MTHTGSLRAPLALLALLALAACASIVRRLPESVRLAPIWRQHAEAHARSPVVYPPQRITLQFNHRMHLQLPNVTCVSCHTTASQSRRVEDRLLPTEAQCMPCHAIDRAQPQRVATPSARCESCHTVSTVAGATHVQPTEIPTARLRFSHQIHTQNGVRCEDCHSAVRGNTLATRLDLPSMQQCVSCHQSRGLRDQCATCHLTAPDGVLLTQFAEGFLAPPPSMGALHHDADFWFTHRQTAAINGQQCLTCHRERECVDCHDGRMRDRRNHPNDYLTLHATEARMASDRCTSCHRAQSFCEQCHARAGVTMSAAPAARGTQRFHPPTVIWSGPAVGPAHHASEARRSGASCVSCHNERDCVSCHATRAMGGAGSNPHPPGFIAQCGALLRASASGCRNCHGDMDALLRQCTM
ncbi:MAG: cytochrome c3 family protein [Deltaproteobacteria bacterium]|nr:cytochrome c3 family protein [Deltaproteobacteria bacterium]